MFFKAVKVLKKKPKRGDPNSGKGLGAFLMCYFLKKIMAQAKTPLKKMPPPFELRSMCGSRIG